MYTYRLIYPKSDKWFFTTYYYRVDSQSQPSLTRAIAEVGGASVFWYARFTWCALTWVTWIWHFEWIILFPVKKPGNYNHSHKFTWVIHIIVFRCMWYHNTTPKTVWDDILVKILIQQKKNLYFYLTPGRRCFIHCVLCFPIIIFSLGMYTIQNSIKKWQTTILLDFMRMIILCYTLRFMQKMHYTFFLGSYDIILLSPLLACYL